MDFEDIYVLTGKYLKGRPGKIDNYYYVKPKDLENVQDSIETAQSIFNEFCEVWMSYTSTIKSSNSLYQTGAAEELLKQIYDVADLTIHSCFDSFFERMRFSPTPLLDTLDQLEKRN